MTSKIFTPIKAIRKKCIDCSAGQILEVRLCPVKSCPLYPYRMGKRPKTTQQAWGFLENKGTGEEK